jgi:hypothetical protein
MRRAAILSKGVIAARVQDHLDRRLTAAHENREKLLSLADGAALIVLAVQDQRRRRRTMRVLDRRQAAVVVIDDAFLLQN